MARRIQPIHALLVRRARPDPAVLGNDYWPALNRFVRLIGSDDINLYWDHIFRDGVDMIYWALDHGGDIAKHQLCDHFLVDSIYEGGPDVIRWVANNPVIGPHFADLLQNREWARRRLLFYDENEWVIRSVVNCFGHCAPALVIDLAAVKKFRYMRFIRFDSCSRNFCLNDRGLLLHIISRKKGMLQFLAKRCHLSPSDLASVGLKFPL
jgi:hypothetical protein